MFFKNYQMLFLMTLISGTLIAVSANSWFTAWLGLEINLMSMVPLMLIKLSRNSTEAAIKYFLTQAMASLILIFSISCNIFTQESISMEIMEFFLALSLIIKAGIAPAHFWFPQVANNLNWTQCFIIFTWQKIAPLLLLASLNFKLLMAIASMSSIIGAMGGFNQVILKLILTYSSISHSGWMIISCLINFNNWLLYFSVYCILSLAIISFFYSNQLNKINQMFLNKDTTLNKIIISLNMLSLGGLPPFLGFTAKLSIILSALASKMFIIFLPLILSSLVSLFFYARVIYSNIMNMNKTLSIHLKFLKKPNALFYTLSATLNMFTPLMFSLI